jgi:predicted AAA+ superfamily ATPase
VVNVGDLNTFERFLRLAAARTGQVINFAELGRDAGVSQPTARKWMSVLEASGQVYLLQPYFRNFGKRLIKSPKLYWLDTGIASYLMGLHSAAPLVQGPFLGPMFETSVVAAWVKAFAHRGLQPQLYYWRSRDGLEVDLLVEHEGTLYPFELKSSATPVPLHAESLQRWMRLPGNRVRGGVVLADVAEPVTLAPGVRGVPWWWV